MIGQQSERLKSFRISREKVIIGFMGCENVNIPLNRWSILLCCATGATGEKRTHTHTVLNPWVLIARTYIKIQNSRAVMYRFGRRRALKAH